MADTTDNILAKLPARLKEARVLKGYSLAALAAASGVSRSMLSQIERGESSPTIATLLHMARALELEFSVLMDEVAVPVQIEVLRARDTPLIENLGAGCRMRVLSPTDKTGQDEVYELLFEAGGVLHRSPYEKGASAHLTIIEGTADVSSGEGVERLLPGDTARYAADVQHRVASVEGSVRAFLVIKVP